MQTTANSFHVYSIYYCSNASNVLSFKKCQVCRNLNGQFLFIHYFNCRAYTKYVELIMFSHLPYSKLNAMLHPGLTIICSLAVEVVNHAREYPQWVFADYESQDIPHQESDWCQAGIVEQFAIQKVKYLSTYSSYFHNISLWTYVLEHDRSNGVVTLSFQVSKWLQLD